MDVTFKTEIGRFNYRVAGILIHENQLLVMTYVNARRITICLGGECRYMNLVLRRLDEKLGRN